MPPVVRTSDRLIEGDRVDSVRGDERRIMSMMDLAIQRGETCQGRLSSEMMRTISEASAESGRQLGELWQKGLARPVNWRAPREEVERQRDIWRLAHALTTGAANTDSVIPDDLRDAVIREATMIQEAIQREWRRITGNATLAQLVSLPSLSELLAPTPMWNRQPIIIDSSDSNASSGHDAANDDRLEEETRDLPDITDLARLRRAASTLTVDSARTLSSTRSSDHDKPFLSFSHLLTSWLGRLDAWFGKAVRHFPKSPILFDAMARVGELRLSLLLDRWEKTGSFDIDFYRQTLTIFRASAPDNAAALFLFRAMLVSHAGDPIRAGELVLESLAGDRQLADILEILRRFGSETLAARVAKSTTLTISHILQNPDIVQKRSLHELTKLINTFFLYRDRLPEIDGKTPLDQFHQTLSIFISIIHHRWKHDVPPPSTIATFNSVITFFESLAHASEFLPPDEHIHIWLIQYRLLSRWDHQLQFNIPTILPAHDVNGLNRREQHQLVTIAQGVAISHIDATLSSFIDGLIDRLTQPPKPRTEADALLVATHHADDILHKAFAQTDPTDTALRQLVTNLRFALWISTGTSFLSSTRAHLSNAISAFRAGATVTGIDDVQRNAAKGLIASTNLLITEQQLGRHIATTADEPTSDLTPNDLRYLLARIEALHAETAPFHEISHRLQLQRRRVGLLLANAHWLNGELPEAAADYHRYALGGDVPFNEDETVAYLTFLERWLGEAKRTVDFQYILDHVTKIHDQRLFESALSAIERIIKSRRRQTRAIPPTLTIADLLEQIDRLRHQPWTLRLPTNLHPLRQKNKQ